MKLAIMSFILIAGSLAHADYTNGYTRANGTYVQGYNHTHADGNPYNNYSTKGNVNPYTGQPGTHQPQPNAYGNTLSNTYGNPNSGWNQ